MHLSKKGSLDRFWSCGALVQLSLEEKVGSRVSVRQISFLVDGNVYRQDGFTVILEVSGFYRKLL